MILEVCVDSPRGLLRAIEAGADRIELCSALALGGLSPNPGLVALASKLAVPVYAMVRPRPGDFIFDADDEAAMLAEIDQLRAQGIAGVVLGANRPDGTLDAELLARLLARAQGMGTTLHRAFDLTPDQPAALETAIGLGFERVLTSGGQRSVLDAVPTLAQLVAQAAGRITIMPGGGIKPDNVEPMLTVAGLTEIHASCRSLLGLDPHSLPVQFGFQPPDEGETDPALVRQMRTILTRHPA